MSERMCEQDHERFRTMLTISALITALGLFVLFSNLKVEAAELIPNGMTCADVQRVADEHQISTDTRWSRIRARAIAAYYGFRITRAQMDVMSKCLRRD